MQFWSCIWIMPQVLVRTWCCFLSEQEGGFKCINVKYFTINFSKRSFCIYRNNVEKWRLLREILQDRFWSSASPRTCTKASTKQMSERCGLANQFFPPVIAVYELTGSVTPQTNSDATDRLMNRVLNEVAAAPMDAEVALTWVAKVT